MIIRPVITKPAHLLATISLFIFLAVSLTNCDKNDSNNNNNNNPSDSTKVDLQLVADGFVSPIGVVASPDNTGRLFVIDQAGKIWIIDQSGKLPTPFIDVTSMLVALNSSYDERGLLGLAFHPQFITNHKFYIYYQLPPRTGNNLSRISEFQASATDPNVADMSSEKILLELDDPQSNHNGGTIAFGPDGFLYISIGDGGAANVVTFGR